MKLRNTGRRYRSAFTLVELLVVIGIIALLAAILLPAMNLAMKKADKVRAQNEINSIAVAVKAYYNDYGKMPAPLGNDTNKTRNGKDDLDFGRFGLPNDPNQTQNKVMAVLRGLNGTINPNKTVYLDIPESSMEGTESIQLATPPHVYNKDEGYFLDPWGNPYHIVMDTDFDGEIKFTGLLPPFPSPSNPGWNKDPIKGQIVGVMSYGPPPHQLKDVLNSWGGDAVKENP